MCSSTSLKLGIGAVIDTLAACVVTVDVTYKIRQGSVVIQNKVKR